MNKGTIRRGRKQLQSRINRRFLAPRGGSRRLLSIGVSALLSISTFLTVIPQTETIVHAEDSKAIVLVNDGAADNISGAQASSVYFGNYNQSNTGSSEPIKWRVLQNNTTNKTLFLLSDKNLDCKKYNNESASVTWEISTLRGWLNGLKRTVDPIYDYSDDNFIKSAFTDKEAPALATTTVVNSENPTYHTPGGNSTSDRVFLLSIGEAGDGNLGFTDDDDSRKSANTAYAHDQGAYQDSNDNGIWWLRSPGFLDSLAASVDYSGYVDADGYNVHSYIVAVRPAFNLNLSSIILTSAAEGGKISGTTGAGSLNPVDNTAAVTEWKLTVHDTSRDGSGKFTAERTDRNTLAPGAELKISYSGAVTGSDKEFVSAIITNAAGTVLYYGHIASTETSASGTATINIPNDASITNTCKLYIFQEQCNGNYKTDYSSKLHDLTAPATKETPTADDFDVTLPNDLVYDGNVKEATATVKSGITGMGTVTVNYYKDGTKLPGAPKDIGTYTVKLDVVEGEGYTSAHDLTKDSWKFTITDSPVAVTGVTVSPKEIELRPGDSKTLTKTIEPDNATDKAVTWSSDQPGVATVDQNGKVTAIDEGEAIITVSTHDGDHTARCKVTVKKDAPVTEECTITFDPNGGKGEMDPQTADKGDTVKLNANEFSRNGYTFTKWNTKADGSGTDYDDKASVKLEDDMTLYAQWEENAPDTYSVTVKTDGNGEASASPKIGKTGDTVNLSAKADKGWKFVKWKVVSGDIKLEDPEDEDTSFVIKDSDVVIKAVFEKKEHKDDDDDDDVPNEPSKPAAVNPDTVEGYFVVGGQIVPNVLMGKMKQGEAAQALFDRTSKAGGWIEAFTFNMAIDGKYEYTLKNGILTIIIPKEYRKQGRTFALMGLDKNANVVILNDTDTNPDTLTVNLNIEGYAFDLIYKD